MPSVLETERLRLRPWRASDAAEYRTLWLERDPRSLRVISADGKPTVDDLRENIRSQLADSARTGLSLLAVERRVENDFIGYCGLIGREATVEEHTGAGTRQRPPARSETPRAQPVKRAFGPESEAGTPRRCGS